MLTADLAHQEREIVGKGTNKQIKPPALSQRLAARERKFGKVAVHTSEERTC